MGRDKIGDISKDMATKAGIAGKKKNHGARRTALVTLTHANIAPNNIVQLSGHRNILSLNEYSELSLQQQKEMSNKISGIQNKKPEQNQIEEIDHNSLNDIMELITNHEKENNQSASHQNEMTTVDQNCNQIPTVDHNYNVIQNQPSASVAAQNLPVSVVSDGINIEPQPFAMPSMSMYFSGASIGNVNIYCSEKSLNISSNK